MLWDCGQVVAILSRREGVTEVLVRRGHTLEKAVNYEKLTGSISLGDEVVVNTTARSLELGSGGYDFVIHIQGRGNEGPPHGGHIMKLRYTPCQMSCLTVEEEESPHHKVMASAESLDNMPVICGSLHSILPAVAGAIKWRSNWRARLAYIMTDGAALPLSWSKVVAQLKQHGLLNWTITVGHAFGGDLEAVNLYSGLLAARHVVAADIAIVCMGPGIVGTGTRYGFTGIELGEIVNAVSVLGGVAVAVPRISFADGRARHRGVSHHTLTALGRVALRPALISLPILPREKYIFIRKQLITAGLWEKHGVAMASGEDALQLLESFGIGLSTMGRGLGQEREFFAAAAAAGIIAWELYAANARGVHQGLDNRWKIAPADPGPPPWSP